jgi:outer membrane protein OmpU
MKKFLIATTALTLSAGFAAAEVKVGGYGYVGAVNTGNVSSVQQRIRLEFTGSTKTSGGVSFEAYVRMNINDTNHWSGVNNNTQGILTDRARITVKYEGLTVAFGNTNGAMRSLARLATYYGFNDGGIFGADNSNSTHTDARNNLLVRYDFGTFSVAGSYGMPAQTNLGGAFNIGPRTVATGLDVTEIAARYSANGITIGAGFDSANRWMVAGGYTMGDLSLTIGTNNTNLVVAGVGYKMGDWDFGLALTSLGGTTNGAIDVGYNLGGGVRLSATAASVAGVTTVGAGALFKF